jgi:cytochrome c5
MQPPYRSGAAAAAAASGCYGDSVCRCHCHSDYGAPFIGTKNEFNLKLI